MTDAGEDDDGGPIRVYGPYEDLDLDTPEEGEWEEVGSFVASRPMTLDEAVHRLNAEEDPNADP